jgi:hypothetical protein
MHKHHEQEFHNSMKNRIKLGDFFISFTFIKFDSSSSRSDDSKRVACLSVCS